MQHIARPAEGHECNRGSLAHLTSKRIDATEDVFCRIHLLGTVNLDRIEPPGRRMPDNMSAAGGFAEWRWRARGVRHRAV